MDKTLKVWDTVSGGLRSTCFHGGSVVSLKWHSTMPVICTAALDNSVRLWDARNGALLKEFTGHRDLVTSIDLLSIGSSSLGGVAEAAGLLPDATDVIVSVSDDNTAKVFLFDIHNL
jgi:ribosome assembly protein SQT1